MLGLEICSGVDVIDSFGLQSGINDASVQPGSTLRNVLSLLKAKLAK
jgi:hypothetical protein